MVFLKFFFCFQNELLRKIGNTTRASNCLDPNQDRRLTFFSKFKIFLSGTLSECQPFWILMWVQTVCKGYQQTTKVTACKERAKKAYTGPFRMKWPIYKHDKTMNTIGQVVDFNQLFLNVFPNCNFYYPPLQRGLTEVTVITNNFVI